MSQIHCAIQGCRMTTFNRPPGVTFYPCPTSSEMRNRWLHALKNKCALLDWTKSRLCSKHFENKYFDSQRKLKENAVPTLFPVGHKIGKFSEGKSRTDRLLSRLTQSELTADIRNSLNELMEDLNFEKMVNDDLKCKHDAPIEAQMWLLIKKQDHLNKRLLNNIVQNKKQTEILQRSVEDKKLPKKAADQSVETYKYIVKCLQEKLATLEEQVEILTAVESR